ncbi:MAG: hypothetical protein AAGD96_14345 [Chloroflexota bacterium]
MNWRIRLIIAFLAIIGIVTLFIYGVGQREGQDGRVARDFERAGTDGRLIENIDEIMLIAAQTPPGPFPVSTFPSELDERTGAIWFFEQNQACWDAFSERAKSDLRQREHTPFQDPNQPETRSILVEFESENWLTFTFLQGQIVACEFG